MQNVNNQDKSFPTFCVVGDIKSSTIIKSYSITKFNFIQRLMSSMQEKEIYYIEGWKDCYHVFWGSPE